MVPKTSGDGGDLLIATHEAGPLHNKIPLSFDFSQINRLKEVIVVSSQRSHISLLDQADCSLLDPSGR
jgi:hypothetical protein